jgi:hypothetical protein
VVKMNRSKRTLRRDDAFRRRIIRAAKVEDLLIYIRKQINKILDEEEGPIKDAKLEVLADIEKHILVKFDYED